MASANERVQVTTEGTIAYAMLSRPDSHNGVDFPMLASMRAAQKGSLDEREIKVR